MPQRILLTGATGFIGGHLYRALCRAGHQVVPLIRTARPTLPAALIAPLADTIPALPGTFDLAIHAAACSPAPGIGAKEVFRGTALTLPNLLEALRPTGCRRLIHLSSISLHGRIDTAWLNEHTGIRDPDLYGLCKAANEALLADQQEIAGIALRLPGVVGPGARDNWLNRTIAAAARHAPLALYNADAPFNNLLHIADLTAFIGALIDRDWRGYDAFPLASSSPIALSQVIDILRTHLQSHSPVRYTHRPGASFAIDITRARTGYGFAPLSTHDALTAVLNDRGS